MSFASPDQKHKTKPLKLKQDKKKKRPTFFVFYQNKKKIVKIRP